MRCVITGTTVLRTEQSKAEEEKSFEVYIEIHENDFSGDNAGMRCVISSVTYILKMRVPSI